ncbi:hypothetical protein GCM10027446_16020 [Angustibacter peucedani]
MSTEDRLRRWFRRVPEVALAVVLLGVVLSLVALLTGGDDVTPRRHWPVRGVGGIGVLVFGYVFVRGVLQLRDRRRRDRRDASG